MYAVHSATYPQKQGDSPPVTLKLPLATMASRGVLFRPFESDEISEFSTLGAKGKIALGSILVANCPLEIC